MRKAAAALGLAVLLLSGCGERKEIPPYRMAVITVGRGTVSGSVEQWKELSNGQIQVKIDGVMYYIEPKDVQYTKGWD